MTMPNYPPENSNMPPTPPPIYSQVPPAFSVQSEASSKKLAAGLCAILIGTLGIHKFILGYTNAGIIMLLVTLLTCGMGGIVMHVIALVEGILYLTKSDADFYNTYLANKREWF